jgi:hypothetical protein
MAQPVGIGSGFGDSDALFGCGVGCMVVFLAFNESIISTGSVFCLSPKITSTSS